MMLRNAGLTNRASLMLCSVCLLVASCSSTTPPSALPSPVTKTVLPPLSPSLAKRPAPFTPLTPDYVIQASPSETFSPTSLTTAPSARH